MVMLFMAACSARLPANSNPSTHVRAPSVSESSTLTRPLVDLRTEVKGKILLHYVADSGDQAEWAGKLKVGNSYKVAVDCVGSQGTMMIVPRKGWKTVRQCSAGFGTYTVDNHPASTPEAETLMIKAPHGARWAVLAVQTS